MPTDTATARQRDSESGRIAAMDVILGMVLVVLVYVLSEWACGGEEGL
jgi:hypothetical protein